MPTFHPLEPLNAAEVATAVCLLKGLPEFTATTRIISIMLKEPTKHLVHSWPATGALPREATATIFDNGTNTPSRVTLDLSTEAVQRAGFVN